MPFLGRRDVLLGLASVAASSVAVGVAACAGGSPSPGEPPPPPARSGLATATRRRTGMAMPPYAPRRLREVRDRLAPLHEAVGKPQPADWLAEHREPGQSFEDYVVARPTAPTEHRRTLVVLPLGAPDEARGRLLALVGEALIAHFGLPSRVDAATAIPEPPRGAHRNVGRTRQLRSGWLLDAVLAPRLPTDAAALLGFTSEDLWPGEGWNFVFGEASLERRVGVWSLSRYGDPASPGMFRIVLRRALKVALHETGHMFSLPHCTRWRCVQAGINSLDEEDRSPLWPCPDCLAKIAWVTSTDPRERLFRMAAFCRRADLVDEARHFDRDLAALG